MSSKVGTTSGSLFQTNLANATSIAADANGVFIVGSGGGGGIITINGDTGSITGSTVSIDANNASNECGISVKFTASGGSSHFSVSDVDNNTFVGRGAGNNTLSGIFQTGFGYQVLNHIGSGVYNIGLGFRSGFNYTGSESSNININNQGVLGESNVIRIGTQGNNNAEQNQCFIAGITGVTTSNSNFVTIDTTTGQLGATAGGGGSVTVTGDTGSITGSTVQIFSNQATLNSGSSVLFANSGTVSTLNVTDSFHNTIMGNGSGSLTNDTHNFNNTGFGMTVLTALDPTGVTGNQNTAFGYQALNVNVNGNNSCAFGMNSCVSVNDSNICAFGPFTLASATSGTDNCAFGNTGLGLLLTGRFNCAIGSNAGFNYAGAESSNICIMNAGVLGESNVMRLGTQGTSDGQINSTFIAGISGATITGAAVLCDTNGQLGTIVSSERFKENIQEIKSSKIIDLTPVSFTYKSPENPPSTYLEDKSTHFGMIAEDVHKHFPELVIYDEENKPFTIKYHEMYALLLAEIKSLRSEVNDLKNQVA